MEEYFVIYDLNDNIIAYCDNFEELIKFTQIRKDNLYNRISKGYCYYRRNNCYKKIYRFFA